MKDFQLFANTNKPEAPAQALKAAKWLRDAGAQVSLEPAFRHVDGAEGFPIAPDDKLGVCDLAVAFGGDGTVLRVVASAARHGTPVLGVHMGRFGFITYCVPGQLQSVLAEALAGTSHVEERLMVRADVVRAGATVASAYGLNEIVLQRGVRAKMMTIGILIDGIEVTSYYTDGIMLSTPTGSTAYNLSAGGPVLAPDVEALVLSAIMPHTLGARPLVLKPETVVRLQVELPGDGVVIADGDSLVVLQSGDEVVLCRAEFPAKLVLPARNDFYERLRGRLLWGARTEGPGQK
jgi:NAD+ kinase